MLCVYSFFSLQAQVVLEDFEGGADLPWNALDGTYDGVVENPAQDGLNTSVDVGSYTKSGMSAFSLFLADLPAPLDLSTNNQFSIQIYAGAPTRILMKLEGTGEAIELIKNIATANVWRTYTFDFSAAAGFTTINRIILFFDPGVEASADTYLFDNIIASPAGDCAGTVMDPTVIDDFECQRNATYGLPGFDDVAVVDNPDASGINISAQVGEYTDREGEFHAMVIDYNSAIDLSVNNNLCIKVWAPVAGNLLFKLEGGISPAVERSVPVTETMAWREYCVNFSDQAAANFEQIVFFFNAGQNGDGDIYYIDDITLTPPPPAEALEDFEDGVNLGWMPLNDDNTLHGTFNGAIANPDASEPNISPTVGSYTRGNSNFSTLTAVLPNGIDLSGNPQLNLDVWAAAGTASVIMQLQSPTEGTKTIEVDVENTEAWETLSFSFADFAEITDFEQISLIFAPSTMGNGIYYFDNLIQGASTVDLCEGIPVNARVFDDFECQRNVTYSADAQFLSVVNNPDITAVNPSLKVGQFDDPQGSFNALVLENGAPFDLSLNNQLSAKIWSPIDGQILFKLEGGTGPNLEVFVPFTATEDWVEYTVDFSNAAGGGYTKLVLFFGAAVDNPAPVTYYIDDIEFNRSPFRAECVANFEDPILSPTGWRYFANGSQEGNAFFISDNPNVSTLNSSARVGTFEEANDGEEFAGMFVVTDAPIALPNDNKTVTMKVLMPTAGIVTFKLEAPLDGAPNFGDNNVEYTTPGEWQELTWDFSSLPDGAQYGQITIIPNFGVIPADNTVHYFDDIAVGGGSCAISGIFQPVSIPQLSIFPNPTSDRLTVTANTDAVTFRVTNLLGQRVKDFQFPTINERAELDVNELAKGMYVLTALDRSGRLVAKTTFVKQ